MVATATVEIRLIGVDLAGSMREMRIWLDHRKLVPHAFRQSACPGGVALHVDFDNREDAEEFAGYFGGRILGERPVEPATQRRNFDRAS